MEIGLIVLAFYSVSAFGFAYVVGHSVISMPVREWIARHPGHYWQLFLAVIECPACFGWWVGFAGGIAAFIADPFVSGLLPVFLPFYTAGSNYILARLTGITPRPGEQP
jgi:hypothetical protein